MPDGRHILLQAPNDQEMNSWISRINYASAFKTAGIRMRAIGMSGKDIELTGKAAAASHLRDLQQRMKRSSSPRVHDWGSRASDDSAVLSRAIVLPPITTGPPRKRANSVDTVYEDLVTPTSSESNTRLLKATFDQVKEELASGYLRSLDENKTAIRPRSYSFDSTLSSPSSPVFNKLPETREVPPVSSRSKIILSKVQDLDSKISLARTQLDTDLRFVRNIGVLAPFQRSTRERLQAAVQTAARRIMQVRLDMEKLVCHRDVLSHDLLAEERDWKRTKKLALRAATLTIERQQQERPPPRMTLSVYVDTSEPPRIPTPVEIPEKRDSLIHRPPSSAGESFHSALEFGQDWLNYTASERQDSSSSGILGHGVTDSPNTTPVEKRGPSFSSGAEHRNTTTLTAENSTDTILMTPVDEQHDRFHHERFFTAPEPSEEQAEEWDKTRAAKRVSLVKVPSELKIPSLLVKHGGERAASTTPTASSPSNSPSRSGDASISSLSSGRYTPIIASITLKPDQA